MKYQKMVKKPLKRAVNLLTKKVKVVEKQLKMLKLALKITVEIGQKIIGKLKKMKIIGVN